MGFRVTGVSLFPRYWFSLRCITRHCFLGFLLAAPPHGIFLHGLCPAARLTRLKGGNYAIYPACPLVWAGVLLVRSAFVPFASPRYGFSLRSIIPHGFLGFSLAAMPHGIFFAWSSPRRTAYVFAWSDERRRAAYACSRPNRRVHYAVSVSRNAPHTVLPQRDARFILAFNAKNTRVLYVYRGALNYAASCFRSEKYTRATALYSGSLPALFVRACYLGLSAADVFAA